MDTTTCRSLWEKEQEPTFKCPDTEQLTVPFIAVNNGWLPQHSAILRKRTGLKGSQPFSSYSPFKPATYGSKILYYGSI